MTQRYFLLCLTAICLPALMPRVCLSEETTIPELEKQIKLRDEAIIELLERVDALEKRTGVKHKTDKHNDSSLPKDNNLPDKQSAQAPGAVVVEEGDAERALERSLTAVGALLLPAGVLEIEPGLAYTRYENNTPGFTTIGTDVFVSETEVNTNVYTASLQLRWGIPWQSQLEISKNYRKIENEAVSNINFVPATSNSKTRSEQGDLRIGLATTLLHEDLSLPDLVGRITWDSDSEGDDSFEELQISFTAIKRQDPVTFLGGLAYRKTFEKNDIEPGTVASMSLGSLLALNPETSMRFIFSASSQGETRRDGVELEGSNRFAASFITGGSSLLARGILLNLSLGIGLTDDAEDFSVALSLPIRF